jgi:carboxypeptidase Taq
MSDNILSAYKQLITRAKDLIVLSSAGTIIQWDMETKMPPKGVEQRSQQLALFSRISHKMSKLRCQKNSSQTLLNKKL